eukprot:TRINITY_DN46061_c0_g1_i1.p1 TRINITY_DN46061_c0_g1~~TRINITY_DN46061_c0_g1_i1.p1  ORF type:complete len:177 (-),score=58.92 TRINITY_DN46061_c0_g1_i1:25-489(-)
MQSAQVRHMLHCAAHGVAPTLMPPRLWRQETLEEGIEFLLRAELYAVVTVAADGTPKPLLLPGGLVPVFGDEWSAAVFAARGVQEAQPTSKARVQRCPAGDAWRLCSTLFASGAAHSVVLNPLPHSEPDPEGEEPALVVGKAQITWLPPPLPNE